MITVREEPVTAQQQAEIAEMLANTPALNGLLKIVRSEIAALQAEAANGCLAHPLALLRQRTLPPSSEEKLAEAARLEVFVTVMTEFQRGTRPLKRFSISAD